MQYGEEQGYLSSDVRNNSQGNIALENRVGKHYKICHSDKTDPAIDSTCSLLHDGDNQLLKMLVLAAHGFQSETPTLPAHNKITRSAHAVGSFYRHYKAPQKAQLSSGASYSVQNIFGLHRLTQVKPNDVFASQLYAASTDRKTSNT